MGDNLRGIILMVAGMFGFALEDMFIKLVSDEIPVGQIFLVTGAVGAVFFAIYGRLAGAPSLLHRDFWAGPVVLRNLGEIIGTAGYVLAIILAPLTTATAVFQALPLAVTLGAAVFLGEKVGWRRVVAIVIGFVGVMIVIRPGLDGFEPAALWGVLAVVGLALRDLVTRRTPARVHTLQLAGWGFAVIGMLGAVMLAVTRDAVAPSPTATLYLGCAILCGVISYQWLTTATRIAESGVTTPFRYTRLLFALVIGMTVFGERLDLWTWVGSGLIVGSGLYALLREARLRKLSSRPVAR